jgi:hypothetical protein
MKQLFRVKLNEQHTATNEQIKDGYLANFDEICLYSRSEANKKAKVFGGKVEPFGKKYHTGTDCKMLLLPQSELSQKLRNELNGRESFIDTDEQLGEQIFGADIFDAILEELDGVSNITGRISNELIEELTVLSVLSSNYQYILTTLA